MQVIDHWLTNNPLQREHDYNHQLTIICHHLFTVGNKREFDRIDELLRLNAGMVFVNIYKFAYFYQHYKLDIILQANGIQYYTWQVVYVTIVY
jgi:hypothetical protein